MDEKSLSFTFKMPATLLPAFKEAHGFAPSLVGYEAFFRKI
jgi:hypothetical protein